MFCFVSILSFIGASGDTPVSGDAVSFAAYSSFKLNFNYINLIFKDVIHQQVNGS